MPGKKKPARSTPTSTPLPTRWRITTEKNFTDIDCARVDMVDGALVCLDAQNKLMRSWAEGQWVTVERLEVVTEPTP